MVILKFSKIFWKSRFLAENHVFDHLFTKNRFFLKRGTGNPTKRIPWRKSSLPGAFGEFFRLLRIKTSCSAVRISICVNGRVDLSLYPGNRALQCHVEKCKSGKESEKKARCKRVELTRLRDIYFFGFAVQHFSTFNFLVVVAVPLHLLLSFLFVTQDNYSTLVIHSTLPCLLLTYSTEF